MTATLAPEQFSTSTSTTIAPDIAATDERILSEFLLRRSVGFDLIDAVAETANREAHRALELGYDYWTARAAGVYAVSLLADHA